MKAPVAILRRLTIRKIIYLDDMLIIGQNREETVTAQDNVIFLLQPLFAAFMFTVKSKKFVESVLK